MLLLKSNHGIVMSLAYAPNGMILASGCNKGHIHLWDLASGESQRNLFVGNPVTSLAFSSDGKTLAFGQSRTVSLLSLRAENPRALPPLPYGGSCTMTFIMGGKFLAIASYQDRTISVRNCETGEEAFELEGQSSGILCVASKPYSPWLVTGGGRPELGELILWDVYEQKMAQVFLAEMEWTYERMHYDWRTYNQMTLQQTQMIEGASPEAIYAVAISPDGETIASGDKAGRVHLWGRESGGYQGSLPGHDSRIVGARFTSDNRSILVAEEKGIAHLYGVATRDHHQSWDWELGQLRTMVFSPDGMTAAIGSDGGDVMVWDLDFVD